MIKEAIESARTVEEAIELGCTALGVEREDVKFEIIDLPKKGFLGLKFTPAKVRVYMESNKQDVAVAYLKEALSQMGFVNTRIDVSEKDGVYLLTLVGDDLGPVIGRRGETIDALQYLAGLVANRGEGDYVRIMIDSGDFRQKREKTLEALAQRLARQVVKTGRSTTLEPMNPYERKIIHAAISEIEGVNSTSIGEEPNRRVVISSTNPRKPYSSNPRPRPQGARPQGAPGRGPRPTGPRSDAPRPYDRDRRPMDSGRRFPPRDAAEQPTSRPATPAQPPKSDAADKPLYSKIDLD